MQKKLVIFDFDGVLVNTADLCFEVHLRANPDLTRERFDSFSHGNFVENVSRAVAEGTFVPQDDWYDQYTKGLIALSSHDVIRFLVEDLSEEYALAICSSMREAPILQFLEKEGIRDCFSDVLGTDTSISKVVKIRHLLEKHSVSPEQALFITDTLGDIRDGNTSGVSSIGVLWGSHDRETLEKGNPFFIAETVAELRDAVERFFNVSEKAS